METTIAIVFPKKTGKLISFFRNVALGFAVFASGFLPVGAFHYSKDYRTGKPLKIALQQKVSWSSVNTSLETQLCDFMEQSEIAVIRDRRLDPRYPISLTTDVVTRWEVLSHISGHVPGTGYCLTDNVVYFGPLDAAQRLPILIERRTDEVNQLRRKMSQDSFRRLVTPIVAGWSELAEPREILKGYAEGCGVRITNAEIVPHDVWQSRDLPKMAFCEAMTVLLNQFDLQFEFSQDGRAVTLFEMDNTSTFSHRYSPGKKYQSALSELWKERVPEVSVEWSGSVATINASLAQHGRLNAILSELVNFSEADAPKPATKKSLRSTIFTFRAERAKIGDLIAYFRANKVKIDVTDEGKDHVNAVMKEIVQLSDIQDKKTGEELFPKIFGRHFSTVDVREDRVILSVD